MSKQMKYSCPNCDSEKIAIEKRPGGWFHCQDCHYSWQPYPVRFGFDAPPRKQTVFQQITASPEVLAPEFIEMMYDRVAGDYRYYSMLTGEFYNSREEAIAATVAKLKEVYNG